jgi:hypothetical protein
MGKSIPITFSYTLLHYPSSPSCSGDRTEHSLDAGPDSYYACWSYLSLLGVRQSVRVDGG